MAKRGWDLGNVAPQANFRPASFVPLLGHSLELKDYALRIENMPNPVDRGSNKPAQRKGSQVTSRVARKWIGLADAGEWREELGCRLRRHLVVPELWRGANSFSAQASRRRSPKLPRLLAVR